MTAAASAVRAALPRLLTTLAPYQAAVVRIGIAGTWGAYLLREWPHRRVLYGDRSPWSAELNDRLLADTHAFTALSWNDGRWWFEAVYLLALLSAAAVAAGWRTRASTVLFALTVLSLQNRNVFLGDGGDNLVHLMAIYLVFTRCGRVWSLDARRRARRPGKDPSEWGEPRAVADALAAMLHNCAMLVIAVQVVLVYATAGWYKVQGARWQDGTAVFYPLKLGYFTPWPELSGLLGGSLLVTFALTYGTVIMQVGFPFSLAARRLKNALLAVMVCEHLAIALLLGLPFFSLAMVSADAVFLPTAFLLAVRGRLAARWPRRTAGAAPDGPMDGPDEPVDGSDGPVAGAAGEAAAGEPVGGRSD
ncbi:HTTM domain-containing protein [Kitasatospora sp. NA04385]|uniref:HTTM domain-containing protein n=1 Tax=Kitasatospora sp. NA04385 TaxID=2742135 RepID=UPI0020CAFDC0|nr:HTTM domain-containing protein [Kitasatospora sp. NA04385]